MPNSTAAWLKKLGVRRPGHRGRLEARVAELDAENRRLKRDLRNHRSSETTAVAEIPGVSRNELRREQVLLGFGGGTILEIGPAHNGILPRRDGYPTLTVDYLSREGLVDRYKEFAHYDPADIEDVDFVLVPGAAMADVIPERFDLVVASHVIEHTTSMIDFLNECTRLLTPNGTLALVVPDHRYCYDRFRERSSISRVIDASVTKPEVHTPGAVIEERLNAVRHATTTAWLPGHRGKYSFAHSVASARARGEEALRAEAYIDTHNWVCSPHHLRLLLQDLADLGFISLREESFHDTVRHEFFINLSPTGPGAGLTREELLVLADQERRSLDSPRF